MQSAIEVNNNWRQAVADFKQAKKRSMGKTVLEEIEAFDRKCEELTDGMTKLLREMGRIGQNMEQIRVEMEGEEQEGEEELLDRMGVLAKAEAGVEKVEERSRDAGR